AFGSGNQKSRGIALAAQVALVAERAEVVIAGVTIARLAVCRADPMPELCDFERSPVQLRQRSDQTSYHAGFAYAARMSADNDNGHIAYFRRFRTDNELESAQKLLTMSC